jgi:hypothetical protein
MKAADKSYSKPTWHCLALFVLTGLGNPVEAQTFSYAEADLCLTFRKVPPYTENNEVVVNLGPVKGYVDLPAGAMVTVPGFTKAQLAPGSFATLGNLRWAAFGWFEFQTGYEGYPQGTVWVTVPRTNNAVLTKAPKRMSKGELLSIQTPMVSILESARDISREIGTSNAYNTISFVRESIAGYPQSLLGIWLGSLSDNSLATLNDTWLNNYLENTTPGSFTGAVRSDLYEVRPLDDGRGNPVDDPHTGNSGLAYYAGFFEFKPDGTMTFTREESQATRVPPPPPLLTIARADDVTTISFVSSNSAIYTLLATNAAGLGAPVGLWPALPGSITGDGSEKWFRDPSPARDRFYRVRGE